MNLYECIMPPGRLIARLLGLGRSQAQCPRPLAAPVRFPDDWATHSVASRFGSWRDKIEIHLAKADICQILKYSKDYQPITT